MLSIYACLLIFHAFDSFFYRFSRRKYYTKYYEPTAFDLFFPGSGFLFFAKAYRYSKRMRRENTNI